MANEEIFNIGVVITKARFLGFFEKPETKSKCTHKSCGYQPARWKCPKCGSKSEHKRWCMCSATYNHKSGSWENAITRDKIKAGPKKHCDLTKYKELSIGDVSNPATDVKYVALRCNAILAGNGPSGRPNDELKDCIFVVDVKENKFLPGDFACSASGKDNKRTLYEGRAYTIDPNTIVNGQEVIDAIWENAMP